MPEILFRAMNAAVGNQDVAVIVLPGDVAVMEMEIDELPVWTPPRLPHIVPQREDIEEMAAHLETGKRITLFCGAGCEGAHDEVVELANACKHRLYMLSEVKNGLNGIIHMM